MRCTALLDVDLIDTKVLCEPFGLDQRRISFSERYNAFISQIRKNEFFLGPDPTRTPQTGVEEPLPFSRGLLLQRVDVMTDLQKAAARLATVHNLVEPVSDTAPCKAFEPRAKCHS